jgi:selenocysteine-specific elongation factor
VIIGTAGHVDHGKTALVRALTGIDTDRLPEEKRRGMSIELGFAPLVLDRVGTVGVVDVPGHDAFVRAMVAGASGIDAALLVVAADEGVMPQTREHLAVLEIIGVRRGVVALTKCDLVDHEWRELAMDDVQSALRSTSLADAPCVSVSVRTGEGIAELTAALADILRGVPARSLDDLPRLPIDRAFSVRGIGTVVTGTLWSGRLAEGDEVTLYPSGKRARVRGVESHGRPMACVDAGSRAAVALAGATRVDAARGSVLVRGAGWTPALAMRADVSLCAETHALSARTNVRLHLGTADVGARVVSDGRRLEPGGSHPVRLALATPIVARAGDRFVLRQASPPATIGGGIVTDPIVRHRRARVFPSAGMEGRERLALIATEAGGRGVTIAASTRPPCSRVSAIAR